ncbi:nitroreductase family protein [Mycoplasma crocodyli]|uniref:Putative NADPH-dependent oxidoreductase n=1 Tax=Mycoplasma crocodyli (strain ATCC 51981 / MP145) TaxID=512564 RepID=D5E5A5_MYCCM|nr:nitroreductase family protein [Mycoplasma crocodyli]ADE19947.1 putative NADPH-dependent oxidoreductase [Mycoplasma crocodyli MP145]
MKNQIVELLKKRSSVREMIHTQLSKDEINLLVEGINSSATSMSRVSASAIIITDQKVKEEIKTLCGAKAQEHLSTSAAIIVFMVDQSRAKYAANKKNITIDTKNLDNFLQAFGDAYIMATNASITANSLGYGTVYLGSLRFFDIPGYLQKKYNLSKDILPVLGLAIGKAKNDKKYHPYHINKTFVDEYNQNKVFEELEQFNNDEVKFLGEQYKHFAYMDNVPKTYQNDFTEAYKKYLPEILDVNKIK